MLPKIRAGRTDQFAVRLGAVDGSVVEFPVRSIEILLGVCRFERGERVGIGFSKSSGAVGIGLGQQLVPGLLGEIEDEVGILQGGPGDGQCGSERFGGSIRPPLAQPDELGERRGQCPRYGTEPVLRYTEPAIPGQVGIDGDGQGVRATYGLADAERSLPKVGDGCRKHASCFWGSGEGACRVARCAPVPWRGYGSARSRRGSMSLRRCATGRAAAAHPDPH